MPHDKNQLIAHLQSNSVQTRSQAILQLQADGLVDADVLPVLVNVLCSDTDQSVLEDCTWVLTHHAEAATPLLLANLAHENAAARHNIVHTLSKIANPHAVTALLGCTKDTDDKVRQKAVFALGQIKDNRSILTLVNALEDSNELVRQNAEEALGRFGDSALPALLAAVQIAPVQAAESMLGLLGDIGDKHATTILLAMSFRDDATLRLRSVEALAAIADQRAQPRLEELTRDSDIRVAHMARYALSML